MRPVPSSSTPDARWQAGRGAALPASMRDLNFAAWHAHIASTESSVAKTPVMPEQRTDPIPDLVTAVRAARLAA